MLTFMSPSSPSFQEGTTGHAGAAFPGTQAILGPPTSEWALGISCAPQYLQPQHSLHVTAPCSVSASWCPQTRSSQPILAPGGDFQSPHYLLCPSNGALPNCLLSPPCPAGSLPCSLPEPGRLIKPCVVLAQGTNTRFRSIWHRNSPRTAASAAATDLTNRSCRY